LVVIPSPDCIQGKRALSLIQQETPILVDGVQRDAPASSLVRRPALQMAWYASQAVLIISLALAAYSVAWEYSMRSYLRGFSDAVVPVSATPLAKIQAILNWMSHGPARGQSAPADMFPDRDPSDTLNFALLLRTCGSATNAFINLADTSGLSARRLLLRDSHGLVMHVVAEVLVGGRWIVVDPAYRVIMKGLDGQPLTREQLSDPLILSAATSKLSEYAAIYNYRNTAHLHFSRFPLGSLLEKALDHFSPGWDGSPLISLIVERSSLAAAVITIGIALILSFLTVLLVFLRRRRRALVSSDIPVQY
jgi:hypothetical protein